MRRYLNSPPPPGYKYDENSIKRGRGGRLLKISNTNQEPEEIDIKEPITEYTDNKYKGVVLTYLIGKYDVLPPLNKTEGWDYICVTDLSINSKDWKIVDLRPEDKAVVGNKKKASSIMFNALNYIEKKYDILVTMDANMFINEDLNRLVDNYNLTKQHIVFLSHPERQCVYDEINALVKTSKDKRQNVLEAKEFLIKENYPRDLGLFATGVMFLDPKSLILPSYLKNMREDYINSPSIRDQVTINYSLYKSIKTLPPLSYITIPFDDIVSYKARKKSTPFIVFPHIKKKDKITTKNKITIYENTPYNNEKDLVKAYNSFMKLIPDNSWALFRDADTLFLDSHYNELLEQAIINNPDTFCFTGVTNRINNKKQLHDEYKGDDISIHRKIAEKLRKKYGYACEELKHPNYLSGFCILIKKSVWKKINGFKQWNNKSKILGVDNKLHKDLIAHNESINVIKGLYMYHWYRGGTTNKKHLL